MNCRDLIVHCKIYIQIIFLAKKTNIVPVATLVLCVLVKKTKNKLHKKVQFGYTKSKVVALGQGAKQANNKEWKFSPLHHALVRNINHHACECVWHSIAYLTLTGQSLVMVMATYITYNLGVGGMNQNSYLDIFRSHKVVSSTQLWNKCSCSKCSSWHI